MDVGAALRAARSMRRLSQRDLAGLAGVPRSTVDRIEGGRMTPRVDTLERLLGAVGYQLVVRTVMDRALWVDENREKLRDRGGRHFPAHLPLAKPKYMGDGPAWWGWHHVAWWDTDPAVPEYMYWHPDHEQPPMLGDPRPSLRGYVWDDAT